MLQALSVSSRRRLNRARITTDTPVRVFLQSPADLGQPVPVIPFRGLKNLVNDLVGKPITVPSTRISRVRASRAALLPIVLYLGFFLRVALLDQPNRVV